MKYALTFTLLGLALVALSISSRTWLLTWFGVCFLTVASAFGWFGPNVLGKRENGKITPIFQILLLPYFLMTWILWHIQRLLTTESPVNEICHGIWLVRRPVSKEIPTGVTLVIDMTAEFPASRNVLDNYHYRCLPTLDCDAPTVEQLRLVAMQATTNQGDVLVHLVLALLEVEAVRDEGVVVACSAGLPGADRLGAGQDVPAILILQDTVSGVEEAISLVKSRRPSIEINKAQQQVLETLANSRTR